MASTSGNPILRQCARLLLPGLVECLAKAAASSDEASPPERVTATVGEINKAFSSLFLSISEELRMCSLFRDIGVSVDHPHAGRSSRIRRHHASTYLVPRSFTTAAHAATHTSCHSALVTRGRFPRRIQRCHWTTRAVVKGRTRDFRQTSSWKQGTGS